MTIHNLSVKIAKGRAEISHLAPGVVLGSSSGTALGRDGVGAVGVALPLDGTVAFLAEVLVLEGGTRRQVDRGVPQRVARSVLASAQGNTAGGVPVTELRNRTDQVDILTKGGGGNLIEGHSDGGGGGARAGRSGGGGGGGGGGLRGGRRRRRSSGAAGQSSGPGANRRSGVRTSGRAHGARAGNAVGRASAPRGRDDTVAAVVGSQERSVGPGEVTSGDGETRGAVKLLGKRAVGVGVGLHNADVAVGISLHSADDGIEGSAARGVGTRRSGGVHILEESEGGAGDGDGADLVPLIDGIVKLLGRGEVGQEPRVAAVVGILGVAADRYGLALGNSGVQSVDGAERVGVHFVVGKGTGRARLESDVVARGRRVKGVNTGEDGVGVLAGAATASVGVDIGAGPEGLHVAENLRSLRVASRAGGADTASESATLDQGAVLVRHGEEGHAVDLLPEISTHS